MKYLVVAALSVAAFGQPAAAQARDGLDALVPDSAAVPTQVLVQVNRKDSRWYGTYGRGILVREQPPGACSECYAWRQLGHRDNDSTSISFDFVNAVAFGSKGEVWYGTVGNGWGRSLDNGRTWKNWQFAQLGPEWQYVAPHGIVVRGDTVVIGTADGLQVTTDDGAHWVAFGDTVGSAAKGPADTAIEVLPSEYVSGVKADRSSWTVTHLHGATVLNLAGCLRRAHGEAAAPCLIRTMSVQPAHAITGAVPASAPVAGSARGWTPWFARPIATEDNPFIDQTYRWGSTMGGAFQAHQGVEFNNPDGTPVHAIGDGTVVYAGRAEGGALTVGIRHDTMLTVAGRKLFVFSTYYHNSALLVKVGDRVRRGDVISRVGNTGRATNDHIHLEIHAAPTDSVHAIIDSLNRYPSYVTNPELWLTPLNGTGVIAGTVVDAAGNAIPQARVYGIRKPLPAETPFGYAETYGPHNRPHPLYGEQFAISDVPAGTHHLFVVINGKRVARTVVVRPGALSWVDFRP
jgi:murein DD-endopeptidase MepM/ murein hydrolase activator NlpD